MTENRWAVVNLSQSPLRFTFLHASEKLAREEAERLAREHQLCRFAVLEVVAVVSVPPRPVDWEELRQPEMPF